MALALDADDRRRGPGRRADRSGRATSSTAPGRPRSTQDEVLVGVRLPGLGRAFGFAVEEVARRHGDFALAGCVVRGAGRRTAGHAGGDRPVRRRLDAAAGRAGGTGAASEPTPLPIDATAIGELAAAGLGPARRPPRLGRATGGASRPPSSHAPWPRAIQEARSMSWLTSRCRSRSTASSAAIAVEPRKLLADVLREDCRPHRHAPRVRARRVRGVHRPPRRRRRALVPAVRGAGRRRRDHDRRGLAADGAAQPGAGGVPGRARPAVRVLHTGLRRLGRRRCLARTPDPSDQQIREGLSGNLCRCTGYQGILRAVRRAAGARGRSAMTAPCGSLRRSVGAPQGGPPPAHRPRPVRRRRRAAWHAPRRVPPQRRGQGDDHTPRRRRRPAASPASSPCCTWQDFDGRYGEAWHADARRTVAGPAAAGRRRRPPRRRPDRRRDRRRAATSPRTPAT